MHHCRGKYPPHKHSSFKVSALAFVLSFMLTLLVVRLLLYKIPTNWSGLLMDASSPVWELELSKCTHCQLWACWIRNLWLLKTSLTSRGRHRALWFPIGLLHSAFPIGHDQHCSNSRQNTNLLQKGFRCLDQPHDLAERRRIPLCTYDETVGHEEVVSADVI